MTRPSILLVLAAWLLSACVAGQHLRIDHQPEEPTSEARNVSVSVKVDDHRSYILNKDKEEYYIGHYRATFGNTFDVTTQNKIPLKEQVQADLIEELLNLGFDTAEFGNVLGVEIVEWNFDSYQNGKFWYQINLTVDNPIGERLASTSIEDTVVIKGKVMTGAKGGFEEQMPGIYDDIIDRILRNNPTILQALAGTND